MEEKNDIEVVIDNEGKDLEISPVYEHLKVAKPNPKEEKDKIIIPEEIKKDDENTLENDDVNNTEETENVNEDNNETSDENNN